jgi:hypothetical protein
MYGFYGNKDDDDDDDDANTLFKHLEKPQTPLF